MRPTPIRQTPPRAGGWYPSRLMEQPKHCQNCGTRLQGPYCHACGQPVKGMVRHVKFILRDVLDTVFEYDSRIWRSLIPLYLNPGRVTQEFLDGRRIRFVLPFRLFFVLTVLNFLIIQLLADPASLNGSAPRPPDPSGIAEAPAQPAPRGDLNLEFDGDAWDPETNPVSIGWLPQAANDRLNGWLERARYNLQLAGEEPDRLMDSFLGLMPAAFLVLMPLFALLLKLFYIGRHWLYTAHLVVALHSHSFLALAMIVRTLLEASADATAGWAWLSTPLRVLQMAAQLWIPVYLLLMQKRVYQQGWAVTVLKYLVIGHIYVATLVVTLGIVAAVALVAT